MPGLLQDALILLFDMLQLMRIPINIIDVPHISYLQLFTSFSRYNTLLLEFLNLLGECLISLRQISNLVVRLL